MVDYFALLVIGHLFGVIVGAGGAFASDLMFFKTIRDRKISKTEVSFLRLGSAMVWFGLLIISFSGLLIFLTDVSYYSASPKFLAKMSIVVILTINGVIFHITHIPLLQRHSNNKPLSQSKEFSGKRWGLLLSGVVSMVSWLAAFTLGSLKSVPYSYAALMGVYLGLLFFGFLVAMLLRDHLLPGRS